MKKSSVRPPLKSFSSIQKLREDRRSSNKQGRLRKDLAPSGLTWNQELFALNMIKQGDPIQAYISSGYNIAFNEPMEFLKLKAERVLKNPKVRARMNELHEEAVLDTIRNSKITADDVIARLLRIADRAEEQDEFTAAIKATELIGKDMGMFKDVKETTVKFDQLSTDDETAIKEIESFLVDEDAEPEPT